MRDPTSQKMLQYAVYLVNCLSMGGNNNIYCLPIQLAIKFREFVTISSDHHENRYKLDPLSCHILLDWMVSFVFFGGLLLCC